MSNKGRGSLRRKNKAKCQKKHFLRKVVERTGQVLTKGDYFKVILSIEKGTVPLVREQSNRVALFSFPLGGKDRTIVYDRIRKTPVTVIPEGVEI